MKTTNTPEQHDSQENRLYNLLKSIENKDKVTEVTAYRAKATKQIEPTPTQRAIVEYRQKYIEETESYSFDPDGKTVYVYLENEWVKLTHSIE